MAANCQPTLFISYARADDESFARKLAHDLGERGCDVWWDRDTMDSRGRSFLQEIRDAIACVDRLILVDDYWKTATVAEVFLLMQQYADAARLYRAAVAMARSERASHESTWAQACRLMAKLNPTEADRLLVRSAFAHLPDCS